MKRRICVFTGGRAEYGLLKPLLDELNKAPSVELKLLVSGMHLSREFGLTYENIEADGYRCDECVEMILSSDTPTGVCKSMGLGMIGFSEALVRLKPDLLVILGDRFESMAAATSAMVCRVPIVHIQGGEMTLGAIDDHIRHAITKMSWLHIVTTEVYRKRVIQLGENPKRVFNYGALNTDAMKKIKLLSKNKLEKEINFSLGSRSLLVTFHPVTLEKNTSEKYFQQILDVIDSYEGLNIIFTKTNADTEGRIINQMIDKYVEKNPQNTIAFKSMGQLRYISSLYYITAVVGNSSSGIIETPTFKVPTINIGEREEGRIIADNIICCEQNVDSIKSALDKALSHDFRESLVNMSNPYEQDNTTLSIAKLLKECELPKLTKKEFYDL